MPKTRGIKLVVERSPGGLGGWHVAVPGRTAFFYGDQDYAIGEALHMVGVVGAEAERVTALMRREFERVRRVEVVAEVTR